jgi:alkylhydroperoxidase family enzyme
MTHEVHVRDSAFARVRAHFDDLSIVELSATAAAYNMASRFLEALRIRSHELGPDHQVSRRKTKG